MTDLISKVDKMVEEDLNAIQEMVNAYTSVLNDVLPVKNIPYIAYLVDVSVKHIKENHNDKHQDWKSWATLLIKKSFEEGSLVNDEDITPLIDEFFEYKEKGHDKWCEDMISASDYDRDRGFFYTFYWKKNR
jgi:hypothetical protein